MQQPVYGESWTIDPGIQNELEGMTWAAKFTQALEIAYESGKIDDAMYERLKAMMTPTALGTMALFAGLGTLASGVPVAGQLMLAYFGGSLGAAAIEALTEIIVKIDLARTRADLEEAGCVIAKHAGFLLSDAVLAALTWGAFKQGSKYEIDLIPLREILIIPDCH